MGRTKLTLFATALCLALMAGCSAPEKEAPKLAEPVKLPPNMSFGYKPPK